MLEKDRAFAQIPGSARFFPTLTFVATLQCAPMLGLSLQTRNNVV
jgi:hypothetical protein